MGFREEEKLLSITKALGWLEMEGKKNPVGFRA